ncbi:MAG: general secretion pathway protein GspK [Planctomycetaceae bacterium]|nr:general secretion pathway protein GspK [Planctomycetales bacterium]MCB9923769.1 general secretion pathway protein GspK [Planctomycetaceae bacterium]
MKHRNSRNRRKGVVLIIVLVVLLVLALAAYSFCDLMLAHRQVATVNGKQLQARMLVQSGAEAIKQYLATDEATRLASGGHFNNPLYFQTAVVLPEQDPQDRGCFTVVAPYFDELGLASGGVRYGLEDESSRLNLNMLLIADAAVPDGGRTLLMSLPGMTEDVADAILDWMDPDEEPREYGAEFGDYYSTLSPPYEPRNGPPQTVEELLLVAGVTPELLFGADFNRNGMIDQHEQAMSTSLGLGGGAANVGDGFASGIANRGWSAYLTLYSGERNVSSQGLPRIFLNNEDLQALHDELSEVFSAEWANFIVAYRLYGPADSNGNGQGQSAENLQLDLTQSPSASIDQVLDLIGATIDIQNNQGGGRGGNQQPTTVASPFQNDVVAMATYLTSLMDNCSVSEAKAIPGRISINEAPRELLLGIPAVDAASGELIMTEELADQIIELRATVTEENAAARTNESWLLGEAVVNLDQMKALMPFVCGGGDVFRCQIVGYFQGGGPSSRAEVVFDATSAEPRELLWRDISHLGRGYALETLGVDLLDGVAAQQP